MIWIWWLFLLFVYVILDRNYAQILNEWNRWTGWLELYTSLKRLQFIAKLQQGYDSRISLTPIILEKFACFSTKFRNWWKLFLKFRRSEILNFSVSKIFRFLRMMRNVAVFGSWKSYFVQFFVWLKSLCHTSDNYLRI